MYEYYSEAKLPYAHYGAGANELDEPGRPPFPFAMAPNAYTGSVALGFKYDDYLDETDVVRYLRGEPITSQLVDRELATRLDEENGPVALNAHTPWPGAPLFDQPVRRGVKPTKYSLQTR